MPPRLPIAVDSKHAVQTGKVSALSLRVAIRAERKGCFLDTQSFRIDALTTGAFMDILSGDVTRPRI